MADAAAVIAILEAHIGELSVANAALQVELAEARRALEVQAALAEAPTPCAKG